MTAHTSMVGIYHPSSEFHVELILFNQSKMLLFTSIVLSYVQSIYYVASYYILTSLNVDTTL